MCEEGMQKISFLDLAAEYLWCGMPTVSRSKPPVHISELCSFLPYLLILKLHVYTMKEMMTMTVLKYETDVRLNSASTLQRKQYASCCL
jgi:hypothetical protein